MGRVPGAWLHLRWEVSWTRRERRLGGASQGRLRPRSQADSREVGYGHGSLAGAYAVVTGSTRGLGLAIARAFVREGAHVVVSSRTRRRRRTTPSPCWAPMWRRAWWPTCRGKRGPRGAAGRGARAFRAPRRVGQQRRGLRRLRAHAGHRRRGFPARARHQRPRRLLRLDGGQPALPGAGRAASSSTSWVAATAVRWPTRTPTRRPRPGCARSRWRSPARRGGAALACSPSTPGSCSPTWWGRCARCAASRRGLRPFATVLRLWGEDPSVPAEAVVELASAATDGKTGLTRNMLTPRRMLAASSAIWAGACGASRRRRSR